MIAMLHSRGDQREASESFFFVHEMLVLWMIISRDSNFEESYRKGPLSRNRDAEM